MGLRMVVTLNIHKNNINLPLIRGGKIIVGIHPV